MGPGPVYSAGEKNELIKKGNESHICRRGKKKEDFGDDRLVNRSELNQKNSGSYISLHASTQPISPIQTYFFPHIACGLNGLLVGLTANRPGQSRRSFGRYIGQRPA